MHAQKVLHTSTDRLPEDVAHKTPDESLTWPQLEEKSNRVARCLISSGIRRKDRVVIRLGNSIETVVSMFGVLKAGGILLMADSGTGEDDLEHIMMEGKAAGLIVSVEAEDLAVRLQSAVGSVCFVMIAGGCTECWSRIDWHSYEVVTTCLSAEPLGADEGDPAIVCVPQSTGNITETDAGTVEEDMLCAASAAR